MKRRQLVRMMAAGGALALSGAALAACNPLERETAPPRAEGGPPVTVRWPPGPNAPAIQYGEEFNKRFNAQYAPRITAVAEPLPSSNNRENFEKWVTMAVSGQLPELVSLCCTWIRPFMLKGLTMDLNPYIRRDWKAGELDDFYKGPIISGTVDGKLYSLPPQININIMYVNKNHLQEAALPYPREDWTL